MKKTLNTPQGQQGPKIDINKTVAVTCDNPECNNDMFMQALKFRKVSKLLAGTPEDQIIPVAVYICTACGSIPKGFDLEL